MLRSTAQARYHVTATLPVQGRSEGVRVVIIEQGILYFLVRFFAVEANLNKSSAWQKKVCRAIGLLYDYLSAVPNPVDLTGRTAVLSNLITTLLKGTIQHDGGDSTGLYWPAHTSDRVAEIVRYINVVSDFCVEQYGAPPINPLVEASFRDRIIAYRRLDLQRENSLLKHLGSSSSQSKQVSFTRAVQVRRPHKIAPTQPPYFPRDKFRQLLDVGFRVRSLGPFWQKFNIRDMMIAILQRHGGLRESEPFHLFVPDVREDPRKPGHAEVRLYHPEDGRYITQDIVTRKLNYKTRTEFLRDRYGRVPRNRMIGKESAGWKDLMLDVGKGEWYALVRWFPQEAGILFWQLYQVYIEHVLPGGLSHPYLFVNLRGEESKDESYGAPYRISAYNNSLKRAVERIGLVSAKQYGTTSHGFRHAYGQDLTKAGVPVKIIQICMHHKSAVSQIVYTQPELAEVHRELDLARQRLLQGATLEIQPLVEAIPEDLLFLLQQSPSVRWSKLTK